MKKAKKTVPPPPRLPLWKNRAMLQFVIVSLSVAALGYVFGLSSAGKDHWIPAFTQFQTQASALLLNLFGLGVKVEGVSLFNDETALIVANLCNGYFESVLLLAGLFAVLPALRLRYLAVILIAILALLALNQVRIVSLFVIQHRFPDIFDTAHTQVWQFTIFFGVLAIFFMATRQFKNAEV